MTKSPSNVEVAANAKNKLFCCVDTHIYTDKTTVNIRFAN